MESKKCIAINNKTKSILGNTKGEVYVEKCSKLKKAIKSLGVNYSVKEVER